MIDFFYEPNQDGVHRLPSSSKSNLADYSCQCDPVAPAKFINVIALQITVF